MDRTSEALKVSVCVITYNQEKYIGECLQSIIDQKTNFEFEIIVGDDFSEDETSVIVKRFADRYPDIVRPVFLKQNIGRGCNNYRVTHRLARGEYISHMDGDDIMEQGKLQAQADFLDENPNCSMVAHKAAILDIDGSRKITPNHDLAEFNDIYRLLKEQCFFVHSSKMYRAAVLNLGVVIDSEIFLDFQLHLECAAAGLIGYINSPLVTYRISENSTTKSKGAALHQLIDLTLKGYDQALDYGVNKKVVLKYKSIYAYKSAIFCLERNDEVGCLRYLNVFNSVPLSSRSFLYGYMFLANYGILRVPVCRLVKKVKYLRAIMLSIFSPVME